MRGASVSHCEYARSRPPRGPSRALHDALERPAAIVTPNQRLHGLGDVRPVQSIPGWPARGSQRGMMACTLRERDWALHDAKATGL